MESTPNPKNAARVLSAAALTGMIGCATAADVVTPYTSGGFCLIKFSEPVVPESACHNCHNDAATPADKGLDLFDITGDNEHVPTATWDDQNRLRINFPRGASCATEYQLSFRPGCGKYLSEKPMPQSVFKFRRPAGELSARSVPGMQEGTVIVFPSNVREDASKEELEFGTGSGVQYVYRRVLDTHYSRGKWTVKYGESVPAQVVPAQLKHGLPQVAMARWIEQKVDWAGITPESTLPNTVLVQPEKTLTPGAEWELRCESTPDKGFREGKLFQFTAEKDIETGITANYAQDSDKADAPAALQLAVGITVPVTEQEARRVFREAEFSIKGAKAATSEDGTCKTITVDGKEFKFTLDKMMPVGRQARLYQNRSAFEDSQDGKTPRSYTPQGVCTGFTVKVEGQTPEVLDVTLPKGITAALGRQSLAPKSHRLTLNPAWPSIENAYSTQGYRNNGGRFDLNATILPAKGEHKVRVTLGNQATLSATACRIPAEVVVPMAEKIAAAVEQDNRGQRIVSLQRALMRHKHGVEHMDVKELLETRQALAKVQATRRDPAARELMSQLQATATQQIAFPAQDNVNCGTTEAVVDLDSLCGGTAAPGLYLLRLSCAALPPVRAALADLELPQDTLDHDRYVLVQVTDLSLVESDDRLLLTRLSDGCPVPQAKVSIYHGGGYRKPAKLWGEPQELKDGYLAVQNAEGLDNQVTYLAEVGGDYAMVGTYHRSRNIGRQEKRALLQTDRNLYRPGDEVHVHGVFRYNRQADGVCKVPGKNLPMVFTVYKPDGKELVKRTLELDANGALDESFTLPAGEEDVTGEYRVEAKSVNGDFRETAYVNAQVFRRDSFSVESELKVEPVRPTEFTLLLTAKDFNGMPVPHGKARLEFSSPVPLLGFGKETYPAPEVKDADKTGGERGTADRHRSGSLSLELDAEGKAEVKGTFAPFVPSDGGVLGISGSVANDREEYIQFRAGSVALFPADFMVDFDKDRLFLFDTTADNKGDTDNTLAREQTLHVVLKYTAEERTTLPNGFVFGKANPDVVLVEKDVTVPANCREGVAVEVQKIWNEFTEKGGEGNSPRLVVGGTDPQGRAMQKTFTIRRWFNGEDNQVQVAGSTCKVEDGALKVQATFLREGTACIFMSNGYKRHRYLTQPVAKGQQTLTLPLQGEEGHVGVDIILMHPDALGNFTRFEHHGVGADVPCTTYALTTQMQLPVEPVRPGKSLHVQGQVKDKDGKGTLSVITLYAVDKGMLTLSRYSVPNLADLFTSPIPGSSFSPDFNWHPIKASKERHIAGMIPGIWGEGLAHVYMGGGDERIMFKSVGRASKAVVVNAMAVRGDDDDDCMVQAECAPAPCLAMDAAVAEGNGDGGSGRGRARAKMLADVDADWEEDEAETLSACTVTSGKDGGATPPRLRTNFQPVAFWLGCVRTDAEGNFSADIDTLPDTLTTYSVYALVLGENGSHFGNAEGQFTVNQPLMLTPGAPLFMSTGDTLRLPLNVTNNSEVEGTWEVTLGGDSQPIRLGKKGIGTLYFDYTATGEGEAVLEWTAMAKSGKGNDAVQAKFPVRYPAPLLKEAHHLVLDAGMSQKAADLLAPELATSTRGEMEVQLSANPLLHLAGCMDFLLTYPYGCTEQTASGLLPWLFYDRLAPVSPLMAQTPAADVHKLITESVEKIFKRQQSDGGLSYWDNGGSCGWASAYAGMVMTIAKEQGVAVPGEKMAALRGFLKNYLAKMRKDNKHFPYGENPMTLFAIGMTTGDEALVDEALELALGREKEMAENAPIRPWRCFWHKDTRADLQLIRDLRREPGKKHEFFLQWMRARGHDYRHTTTWRSGWMMIALHQYLRLTPASSVEATVQLQDGSELTLNQGITILKPQGKPLSTIPTEVKTSAGTAYAVVKVKAQPDQIEYPGVTEKGLQITRIYEKKDADGVWREAKEFAVGDVVRVTLTCAKMADELEYFVLEDYLPSCMEAINPNVPSQAAGLSFPAWSTFFDHKEYLADRVRGFCTRWYGRDLLNMSYYARVKRAGSTMAPPAQAQLMYEPQTYGLSPNRHLQSK